MEEDKIGSSPFCRQDQQNWQPTMPKGIAYQIIIPPPLPRVPENEGRAACIYRIDVQSFKNAYAFITLKQVHYESRFCPFVFEIALESCSVCGLNSLGVLAILTLR